MTERELHIKAHNYTIQHRQELERILEVGSIDCVTTNNQGMYTKFQQALMEVYKIAFREGQKADITADLEDTIDEQQRTIDMLEDDIDDMKTIRV